MGSLDKFRPARRRKRVDLPGRTGPLCLPLADNHSVPLQGTKRGIQRSFPKGKCPRTALLDLTGDGITVQTSRFQHSKYQCWRVAFKLLRLLAICVLLFFHPTKTIHRIMIYVKKDTKKKII